MVFNSSVPNSPRNRHAVSVGKQKVQSPPYQISPARVKLKQEVKESDPRGLSKAKGSVTKPVALSLVDFSYVLSLVFGGCCSNVYTYEYLLKLDPHLGTALTFSQMLFVTLHSLPSFLEWRRISSSPIPISIPTPRLKPRQVPLSQWALQVLVLTIGSLLNNWAFGFSVPLTVQIVFRSAGLAVSMLFGRLFLAKRYSYSQVASVLLVTLGVILATTSRPSSKSSATNPVDVSQYTIGVAMLTVSLLLTGVLGILQERTYTKYGPCWKEGVFYTHALSLPIFILFVPSVQRGFNSLNTASAILPSDPNYSPDDGDDSLLSLVKDILGIPIAADLNYRPYTTLLVNLVTQLICVSGVNQMTSRISSVSTNIVLTTRKALSLVFSVWWFGNGWNAQLGSGAGLVFLGSILYTAVTSRSGSAKQPTVVEKVEEVEVKVKVDEIEVDEVVHQSPLATAGHVRTVTRRLEREAVVKLEPHSPPERHLEPHSPPESVSLVSRKWKGKGRMVQ